jgi:hypothetical protein
MGCAMLPVGTYLWFFLTYAGQDIKLDPYLITAGINKTRATVRKLTEPLLKQGQTAWIDNFRNSPSLAKTFLDCT